MREGQGSQDTADNPGLLGWSQTGLKILTFRMWRQRMGIFLWRGSWHCSSRRSVQEKIGKDVKNEMVSN